MDYEVYAYLQLGQDAQAKAVIDDMVTVAGFTETFLAGPFALAASPARYAVERGNWKEAAALEVRPSPLPYVTAISWFAKALGAARSGDTVEAQAAIAHLIELRDQLREKKDAYWSEQVDIQARVATAWTQYAAGHQDEALKALADAADAEDRTEKHPVTPGPLAPARELYGVMLLQHGNAAEALVAFEATMRKEPNRLNAILGAANSAAAVGRQRQGAAILHRRRCTGGWFQREPARGHEGARIPGEREIARPKCFERQALLHRRMRAVVWGIVLFGLAGPSGAQTRSVSGQTGMLGEWELTATVAEQADGAGRRWTGPLSLRHVGFCSADGPEEKTGELRLSVSDSAAEATATLMIEGTDLHVPWTPPESL